MEQIQKHPQAREDAETDGEAGSQEGTERQMERKGRRETESNAAIHRERQKDGKTQPTNKDAGFEWQTQVESDDVATIEPHKNTARGTHDETRRSEVIWNSTSTRRVGE